MTLKEASKGKREYYIALIFLIISVVFWGYSFISTKIVLAVIPPVTIAFLRQIIAAVTLFAWLLFTKSFTKVSLKHMAVIALSGFFGIVLYFVFENNGLKLTSASNASMIVSSVPIFTLFTEAIFYKMKITARMVVCILLSIAGVYLVVTVNGRLDFSSSMFLGNMLMIGAMVAWVVYVMLNKGLSENYSGVIITFYQTLSSIVLFIPFIIPEIHSWKPITLIPLLNLLYLGIFCSAFAYFFYIYATKRLGATVSSAFLNLVPIVTVISGFLVLHESLAFAQIAGMALIMISLFKLSRK